MKYPYLIGERTPARTADEFRQLSYNEETKKLRHDFYDYLKTYDPVTFDLINRIWELEIAVMRWPNEQSDFLIAIINARARAVVALFPTFKKACRALRAISKLGMEDLPF